MEDEFIPKPLPENPKEVYPHVRLHLHKTIGSLDDETLLLSESSKKLVEGYLDLIGNYYQPKQTFDRVLDTYNKVCMRYLDQYYDLISTTTTQSLASMCAYLGYRLKLIGFYKLRRKYGHGIDAGFSVLSCMVELSVAAGDEEKGNDWRQLVPRIANNHGEEVVLLVVDVVLCLLECAEQDSTTKEEGYRKMLSLVDQIKPWIGHIQNAHNLIERTSLLVKILTSYTMSMIRKKRFRVKTDLATKFCVQALQLSATNQEMMFQTGEKVCEACFAIEAPFLPIIEIVLGAIAEKCKVDDQDMDVYFLKLMAYCIEEFKKVTDDLRNSVALLFTHLAESQSVKDKFDCLLELYGYSFVRDVSFYVSSDKDKKDDNNTVLKVLSQLENRLIMIKSIMDKDMSLEWSESYSLGRRLLCENLSLILTNTFKDISEELKEDSNAVNLPTIEEFLYSDISNSSQETGMNNTKRAINIVEGYYILSLITKQKTKRIESLQGIIESSLQADVHKLLYSYLPDVSIALSKANQNDEVKEILKPFCNAAWNTVLKFCDTFSSGGKSKLLEESIVHLVRQASELSGLYLNQLHNCEREKMVIHFVKRWEEAQLKFPIPSPVSMINQWVMIQCMEIQDPKEEDQLPTLDSLKHSLETKEAVGIILEEELQACLNNEINVSNKKLCELRQIKIQKTLEENNGRTDARLNRSRELIKSGKRIRENGVVGLKDCIDYISQALAIMTDLSDKSEEAHEYLPQVYCYRALYTREAEPKSKVYINDVERALNLWVNDKQLRLSDDTSLVYVIDLLSLDGYTEHESKISNIFFQKFQSKEYSPQKWVNMLWKDRLFDHTICGSPINDECTKILGEKHGSYADVTFLAKNSELNEVSIGVRNSLCLNSTLSCNHDDHMQSKMTDGVKHAVTRLTNDDSSSQTTNSFFAAYMCYDLAQRLIAKGSMIEALCYAKKSFDWRKNYYSSCCIVDFEQETFAISSNVAIPALSYNISSNKEHMPSPWRVLQCYLQSSLQLGSIYNFLGDGDEASRYLQDGKALSLILNLPTFAVSISSELVKLHRKHLKWNEAETELEIAQEKLADIQKHEAAQEHSFCKNCITVLEVSVMQQLGDLYFDMFISKKETTKDLEDVVGFYKGAENLLKHSLWENDVSCPKDECVKTARYCAVIDPNGSSNHKGCLKECWHCQRDVVAASKSLTMHLNLKWECLRRRLLIRVLKGIAKYHEARGHTDDARKVLLYSVSVMVSRVASKEQNSLNLVASMIDNNWTGDAYSIEQASVMYDIGCFFLKYKNDESNEYIKMPTIVLGLKIAFLLSREVPALFQKVSQLLAVLYTLSPSIKEFKMSETSLSESQWASYFQQASIGTHLNHAFVTRVKRAEDKFTAKNPDIDEASLPISAYKCLQLPPHRVKDLEDFIHGFYKSLPKMTIICMNFLEGDIEKYLGELLQKNEAKSWIMISRIYMGHMPISIVLPIGDTLINQVPDPVSPWVYRWRGTIIDRVAPEYKSIHWTKQDLYMQDALVGDKRWSTLDGRVRLFLKNMQSRWINPWQNLLLGGRSNDVGFNLEVGQFKKDLKAHCNLEIQESILEVMIECAYEHFEDLGFLAEAIFAKGCYSGPQSTRNENPTVLTWISGRLEKACRTTNKESPREPLILVMDSHVQMLPWENMDVLRNEEAYRMPSVPSIVSTLCVRSYYERGFMDASFFPTIDPMNSFYLLNASRDLDLGIIQEWFRNSNIEGIAKREPSEDDLRLALTTKDLYIYLSHDSGEQYIAGSVVEKLDKCAAALLLGCSSGLLTLCGSLRYKGAPIHYLLGGSPSIFCNLWDMGSHQMEWYTMTLVKHLMNAATTKQELDAVYLGSFLTKLRKEHEFQYLWGASTVCYGVPTSIISKGT